MSAIKYRVSIIKACGMLGHILMLVTIIPEEESLMRDCTYEMLVINDRLDYLSLYAERSSVDGASSIIGTISNAHSSAHRQMATPASLIATDYYPAVYL
jgi:hypothetical protein